MPGHSWYYRNSSSARYPSTPIGRQRSIYLTEPQPTEPPPGPYWMQRQKSSDEIRESLERLSRPTMASNYRTSCPGLSTSSKYITMDGHYVWHKMDLLRDSYKCLYTRSGSVKVGTAL